MKKFLPYELGIDIVEIGFKEESPLAYYNLMDSEHGLIYAHSLEFKNFKKEELSPAPTWSEAFEWFLKEKEILVTPCVVDSLNSWLAVVEAKDVMGGLFYIYKNLEEEFSSYEDARYNSYKKAINLFKTN